MADRLFATYRVALLTGGANVPNLTSNNLKIALVRSSDVDPNANAGGHDFLDDISAGVLATTGNLTSVTVSTDGVVDAANAPITDPGGGATADRAVLYYDTGTASTSRLIHLWDTGISYTLDGTNDNVVINASGMFKL
jgi:hypothetical protein